MASPSDVAKTDGFLRFGTRVFNFRIPICRPSVDFAASFKSSIGAPEAASFVTVLTQTRIDMIHIIYNTSGIYDQKLKAVETYLLLAWKLADLFASQKLQLDKDLCFEWRGAITDKPDCSKSSDIIFELLLLLHTKAIMHSIVAKSLLDTDPVTFLSDAAKHFMAASSIMTHMAANIGNGTWNRTFSKRGPNPPEVSEHMCAALAALFKGQAQALSVMKAITSGSAPPTIRARLAVGVVKTMDLAFDTLSLVPECTLAHADLLTHMHVTRQFYTALAYQHAALAYVEKTEVGNAIAFCLAGKARLEPQKSSSKPIWASPGMPKHVGAYADIGPALAHVADALNQIQSSAEQDNKFVYFQPVPGPYSTNSSAALPLPDLPPEACVMNPGPFTEPDRSADPLIQFEYKAKPSIFSSMFSSLVGGGGLAAPPPPAAEEVGVGGAPSTTPSAPPPAMSDEEYARSLQRQFDADTARAQQQQQHPPAAPAGPVPGAGAGDQKPAAAPRYNSLV